MKQRKESCWPCSFHVIIAHDVGNATEFQGKTLWVAKHSGKYYTAFCLKYYCYKQSGRTKIIEYFKVAFLFKRTTDFSAAKNFPLCFFFTIANRTGFIVYYGLRPPTTDKFSGQRNIKVTFYDRIISAGSISLLSKSDHVRFLMKHGRPEGCFPGRGQQ